MSDDVDTDLSTCVALCDAAFRSVVASVTSFSRAVGSWRWWRRWKSVWRRLQTTTPICPSRSPPNLPFVVSSSRNWIGLLFSVLIARLLEVLV